MITEVDFRKIDWNVVLSPICGKDPLGECVVFNVVAPNHADDPKTPGWTLQGKAYLNFAVNPLLTGVATSSCEIDGTSVDAAIVYDVIGGDVWLSNAQISVGEIIGAIPTFQVVPETSKFKAVRIDGKHGAADWGLDVGNLPAACVAAVKRAKLL